MTLEDATADRDSTPSGERGGKRHVAGQPTIGEVRTGVPRKIVLALAEDLWDRGKLELTECFVDVSFGVCEMLSS